MKKKYNDDGDYYNYYHFFKQGSTQSEVLLESAVIQMQMLLQERGKLTALIQPPEAGLHLQQTSTACSQLLTCR